MAVGSQLVVEVDRTRSSPSRRGGFALPLSVLEHGRQIPLKWVFPVGHPAHTLVFAPTGKPFGATAMSSDPTDEIPENLQAPEQPLDPARERARILALLKGRRLNAYEAEMICATLAILGEMDPGQAKNTA